jgi:pyrroline-5-carboxylate reductase
MARLLVIGGGRMGEALVAGLVDSGRYAAEDITVIEKLEARRAELAGSIPGLDVVAESVRVDAETIVAVKPGDVAASLEGLKPDKVLSIAAGVTTAALEAAVPAGTPVVRAMPNTPALVGQGAAAIAAGAHAGDADMAWAEEILGAVGTVVRVPEGQLDAVTGLSGSGPAYVFLVAEALIDAGVLVGLPRPAAEALATQTLLGAATLLASGDRSAADRRADVTSPGGTTAAGLRALESAGVRAAIADAVVAATARSKELGS